MYTYIPLPANIYPFYTGFPFSQLETMKRAYLAIAIILVIIALALMPKYWREELSPEAIASRSAIPWKALVPGYTFFASIAVGLAILSGAANLGYLSEPRKLAALALASLIPAWTLVFLDLGRPDHVLYILLSFNPSSRIAWNVVLYSALAILLLIALFKESKVLGALEIFFAIALESNLAMAFGVNHVPVWEGTTIIFEFIASAIALGSAVAIFFLKEKRPLSKVLLVSLFALFVTTFWEHYYIKTYEKEVYDALNHYSLLFNATIAMGAIAFLLALIGIEVESSAYLASLATIAYAFLQKMLLTAWGETARIQAWLTYKLLYYPKAFELSFSESVLIFSAFLLWIGCIGILEFIEMKVREW